MPSGGSSPDAGGASSDVGFVTDMGTHQHQIQCDHTSVGMLVFRDDKLLVIERRKPPYGFAPPAGHVDERSSFDEAAREELREEVGLEANHLALAAEGKKNNPCRRPCGTWHYWKIYRATVTGRVRRSHDETKQVRWCSPVELERLAGRTRAYLAGMISDDDWMRSPGLEPVWMDWLIALGILTNSPG